MCESIQQKLAEAINQNDHEKATELFFQCVDDLDCDSIDHFLNFVDIETKNKKNHTALQHIVYVLHKQCGSEKFDVVFDKLIEKGANVNVKNKYSLLYSVSEFGCIKCVEKLIKAGADVHFKAGDKMNVISIASRNEHFDIVKVLLDAGADPNSTCFKEEQTPLIEASVCGNVKIISELLSRGANINYRDKRGDAALLFAVGWNEKDAVELLLASGADIDIANNNGVLPITMALKRRNIDMVKILIKAGADVNVTDSNRDNIPMRYIKTIPTNLFMELLNAKNLNINHVNKKNETLLFLAIKIYPKNHIEKILKRGADPNFVNKDGDSLLIMAIKGYYRNESELLIEYGADVDYINKKRETALSLILQKRYFREELAEMIKQRSKHLI